MRTLYEVYCRCEHYIAHIGLYDCYTVIFHTVFLHSGGPHHSIKVFTSIQVPSAMQSWLDRAWLAECIILLMFVLQAASAGSQCMQYAAAGSSGAEVIAYHTRHVA
jgi:hypothetical protein